MRREVCKETLNSFIIVWLRTQNHLVERINFFCVTANFTLMKNNFLTLPRKFHVFGEERTILLCSIIEIKARSRLQSRAFFLLFFSISLCHANKCRKKNRITRMCGDSLFRFYNFFFFAFEPFFVDLEYPHYGVYAEENVL